MWEINFKQFYFFAHDSLCHLISSKIDNPKNLINHPVTPLRRLSISLLNALFYYWTLRCLGTSNRLKINAYMRELWSMSFYSIHCALDNYILNDWCCYPAIFKHYQLGKVLSNNIRYNEWCALCLFSYVYIQFSRQLHAKNTPTRRQISSSIIIIYHIWELYRNGLVERRHFLDMRLCQ